MEDEKPKSLQECFERLKKGCELLTTDEYGYTDDYGQFNPSATEEEILDLEKHLGFRLPHSYREFLKFSNGAQIMGTSATIYGIDMIGISDPMVPDGYLTIGEYIGDGERLALSEADGEVYTCYNGRLVCRDLEDILLNLLEECEELVESCKAEREREERRKAGVTYEQEMDEIRERLRAAQRKIADKLKK